jgi:hypothetical protein
MSCIIIVQSFGIYKLINKQNIIPKNLEITSSAVAPKIIYKDKIVYKENPINEKIIYQTRMFLDLRLEFPSINDTSMNFYSEGPKANESYTHTQMVALENSNSVVLTDMIIYNKAHSKGGN